MTEGVEYEEPHRLLDKKPMLLWSWRVKYLANALVLAALWACTCVFWWGDLSDGAPPPVFWAWLVPALVLPLLALGFVQLQFSHYQAALLQGQGLVLRSGVWWRNEAWVPIARLQHLDVNQGPLDRLWGMASLVLHTAGSHDHRTVVQGLPLAEAQALRAQLLPREQGRHE